MLKIDKEKFESSSSPSISRRHDREYLLKKGVASELNTYLGFTPFYAFAEAFTPEERVKMKNDPTYDPKIGLPGVRSIFNKSAAVLLGDATGKDIIDASEWRISNNVPLIDSPNNRKKMRANSGYTIKELVEASQSGLLGKAVYSYADFMYCKHLGKMPNNYLITLRRFPTPVDDYISSTGFGKTRQEKNIQSDDPVPMGAMVTWLNVSGNNMDNILTYSVSMPFKEESAQIEENNDEDADKGKGPLNAAAAIFDQQYVDEYQKGYAGGAVNDYLRKFFPKNFSGIIGDPPYQGYKGWRDNNKTYGPVDAVKRTYYRSDEGINFNQSIKLVFEYELKSYNGINGRQAMIDLISNILTVTYTTGTFWGGGYVSRGAHQNNLFTRLEIFKNNKGFTGYMDAFMKDLNQIKSNVGKSIDAQGGPVKAILNFFNNLGGMLLGGALNALGRPQKSRLTSLLSPAPTGFWHVMIGNPFHPIMSLGNMILKNTTITHTGPLGLDDFPTGLKVECELERGKPRDLRGIEMIYMNGNDRVYTPMGPKIFEMYTYSKEYRDEGGTPTTSFSGLDNQMKKIFIKYFGTDDTTSIRVQSEEQEYGAWKKNEDSSGDVKERSKVTGK